MASERSKFLAVCGIEKVESIVGGADGDLSTVRTKVDIGHIVFIRVVRLAL